MTTVNKLREDIDITKRELKNLRQEIFKQKAIMKTEAEKIYSLFTENTEDILNAGSKETLNVEKPLPLMTPIGFISSCFKFKNGIPRQPSLCPSAKGTLKIEKSVFTNPEHSLIGLEEFSHIWILFIFHENDSAGVKAKVHPPRLNGTSVGVFSTRSPHRPSAVGLSLTQLDKIDGDTLYLSGIDLLDGTPVIDIKPYIPMYDNPHLIKESSTNHQESNDSALHDLTANSNVGEIEDSDSKPNGIVHSCNPTDCKTPEFLREFPQKMEVVFTNRALKDLESLSEENLKLSIVEVLQSDPRSVYRKEKCTDRLYYFSINQAHVTCWFDDCTAEVLRIKPLDH